MRIAVQSAPFDAAAEIAGFGAGTNAGALVTFTGLVRDDSGRMQALELEHYPGMTERAITRIAEEAMTRWSLADCLVIHRFGRLTVGEPIMMVATAARHRAAAFEAAEFLMDYLKSRAPFWKKEIGPDGASWVAAKASDEDALTRW
ncbi:molybdenum cofactor biosynthesis protein MoaE [Sinirhodobacter huangdaonensis]|uniref:Molybdopterin synthase catalytic subunit n=1 Tax=Paenirhodobacter huangdaonensis TaxID=2501515 RepID=A0A3S4MIQ3_9RHOB|nr:molybdenum cofactor biosynthesis protein MoaE [Sinirhodobacter huangdaonensis]RWR53434.1 molybdenum cofactor biosynthesis protein MoaE [Sinirhodobacter huangdaonensis]